MDLSGATYHLQPLGRTFHAAAGQTLMQAAVEAGLKWPTICGGLARCGVCHVLVESSSGPPPPVSDKEMRGLRLVPRQFAGADTRLACQFVGSGDVSVRKNGVEPRA